MMLEKLQAREKSLDDVRRIYASRFVTEVTGEYPSGEARSALLAEPQEWFVPEELEALNSKHGQREYLRTERANKQHDEWLHRRIEFVSPEVDGLPSPFTHAPERFRLRTIHHTVRPEEFAGLLQAVEIVLERQTAEDTAMHDIAAVMFAVRKPEAQLLVMRDRTGEWTGMVPGPQSDYVVQRMLTVADMSVPENSIDH